MSHVWGISAHVGLHNELYRTSAQFVLSLYMNTIRWIHEHCRIFYVHGYRKQNLLTSTYIQPKITGPIPVFVDFPREIPELGKFQQTIRALSRRHHLSFEHD